MFGRKIYYLTTRKSQSSFITSNHSQQSKSVESESHNIVDVEKKKTITAYVIIHKNKEWNRNRDLLGQRNTV